MEKKEKIEKEKPKLKSRSKSEKELRPARSSSKVEINQDVSLGSIQETIELQKHEFGGQWTPEVLNSLLSSNPSDEELFLKLSELFNLSDFQTNTRNFIEIELYFFAIRYATEYWNYTISKISPFLCLLRDVHEGVVKKTTQNIAENFHRLKQQIMSLTLPAPNTPGIYTMMEAKNIIDFFSEGYFQHYKLYEYAFNNEQDVQEICKRVLLQTAIQPPPLSSSTPEEIWRSRQEKIRLEEEAREKESQRLRAAVEAAMEERGESHFENVTPDMIRDVATSVAQAQVDVLRQSMKQKLEEQERAMAEKVEEETEKKKRRSLKPNPSSTQVSPNSAHSNH